MKHNITMLGGGSWGTAVANMLAHNGNNVLLWCYETKVCQHINNQNENTLYLPQVKLHPNLTATNNLNEALQFSSWIFEAIPVAFLRQILKKASKMLTTQDKKWILLSKGIEKETLFFPSEIITSCLQTSDDGILVASGPSFARELAAQCITAVTLAGKNDALRVAVNSIMSNHYFKTMASQDLIGTQIGGAFKNVCAIAAGIICGLAAQSNTVAYIITKCMQELAALASHLGGKSDTIYGLAGFGDVFLTCSSELSKNFRAGKLLRQYQSLNAVKKEFPTLPEGINTVQSLRQLTIKQKISLPVCEALYKYIFENQSIELLLNCGE